MNLWTEKIMIIDRFKGHYWFLSNFYKGKFFFYGDYWTGRYYNCAEYAFQASKTFDPEEKKWVLDSSDAAQAKSRGRKVSLRSDWGIVSYGIMYEIVAAKFSDPQLQRLLLSTENAVLRESNNWHDNKWGDCTCANCKDITGDNFLGIILMNIRKRLESVYGSN